MFRFYLFITSAAVSYFFAGGTFYIAIDHFVAGDNVIGLFYSALVGTNIYIAKKDEKRKQLFCIAVGAAAHASGQIQVNPK